jgi:hypothetical protein
MAFQNPRKIRWNAPTENIDNTPIDYALAYNLYVDGALYASFPGTLNANGEYEFEFGGLTTPFPRNTPIALTLSAFSTEHPEREGPQSEAVMVEVVGIPKAPFNVVVE